MRITSGNKSKIVDRGGGGCAGAAGRRREIGRRKPRWLSGGRSSRLFQACGKRESTDVEPR